MPKIIVEQTDYLLKNISAKAFETVMELSSKIPENLDSRQHITMQAG